MATFQIKDFASITASMLNMLGSLQTKVTDFNVGSIIRTMLEATAAEMDELYQQMLNGLIQAIPVSVYNSFTFPALTATPASGLINVMITTQTTDTLIAGGSVFTAASNGVTYASVSDVTIAAGATSDLVPVVATASGSATNVGTTAFAVSPSPSGFVSANNPNAFINGTDDETDAEQLIRFNGYISTLARGSNAAIEYGAETSTVTDAVGNVIERVATAHVIEPYLTNPSLSISSINCYIHNGVGGTSAALVARAQAVVNGYTAADGVTLVPGWKSAGVVCTVAAATEQPVALTATLTAAPGYVHATLVPQALSAVTAYLLTLPLSATAIFALLETLVMTIPGVANFVITAPTADTAATAGNYKIMPGVITIS